MKSSGKFVVCDRGNERSRMQIFTKHGHFVRYLYLCYHLCNAADHQGGDIHDSEGDIHDNLYFRKIAIRYIDIVAGLAITR